MIIFLKKINYCLLVKQYIFYKLDNNASGWLIILREKYKNHTPDEYLIGYGQTLLEADLNFTKQRIEQFTQSSEKINRLLELDIPITREEMLTRCQEVDNEVEPLSINYTFDENCGGFIETASLCLSCSSKTRKFILEIDRCNPTWKIIRYVPVDGYYIDLLTIETIDKTLQKTFKNSELEYHNLVFNSELLAEKIHEAIKQELERELEEQKQWDIREGEAHINWLLSEVGEDAFPDRD